MSTYPVMEFACPLWQSGLTVKNQRHWNHHENSHEYYFSEKGPCLGSWHVLTKYTVFQKKEATKLLAITLSNL